MERPFWRVSAASRDLGANKLSEGNEKKQNDQAN